MCGIAGFYNTNNLMTDATENDLKKMIRTLAHRGPDDEGYYFSGSLGLAQRRLSIIDLSQKAHQPMHDDINRLWIAFNGEIYNFQNIKEELLKKKYEFQSTSDTEVILYAYREWGEECLKKFIGMFAFALWDEFERKLFIARDRLGIKPLYYYYKNGAFVFASELKAILKHPHFEKTIDFSGLYQYLIFQYVPEPKTIYNNTFKLSPGSYMIIRDGEMKIKSYWDIEKSGQKDEYSANNEYLERFESLLKDSIKLRQISDVPIGAFLSGGIDSSTVVALLQEQNNKPVRTFSIGFNEQLFDEAPFARKVADFLNTDHTEMYVTPKEAMDVVALLPVFYDEPFSDSSAIPTYLVSKIAREHVKVCISGDGGDELFSGYNRYTIMNMMKTIPLRKELAALAGIMPEFIWKILAKIGKSALPMNNITPERLKEVINVLKKESIEIYLNFVKIWGEEEAGRLLSTTMHNLDETRFYKLFSELGKISEPEKFTLIDIKTYLTDDILTKVDRASMAHGLEVRVPFLDHRVVEFSGRLPFQLKLKGRETKHLLKKLLFSKIPSSIFARPKQGFSIPVSTWLKNELKYLVDEYLNPSRIRKEGIFNENFVLEMTDNLFKGHYDNGYRLYNLLMFQMWFEKYMLNQ